MFFMMYFYESVIECVNVNVVDILFAAFRASLGFFKTLGAHLTLDPKLRTFSVPLPAVNQQVGYRGKFSRLGTDCYSDSSG